MSGVPLFSSVRNRFRSSSVKKAKKCPALEILMRFKEAEEVFAIGLA